MWKWWWCCRGGGEELHCIHAHQTQCICVHWTLHIGNPRVSVGGFEGAWMEVLKPLATQKLDSHAIQHCYDPLARGHILRHRSVDQFLSEEEIADTGSRNCLSVICLSPTFLASHSCSLDLPQPSNMWPQDVGWCISPPFTWLLCNTKEFRKGLASQTKGVLFQGWPTTTGMGSLFV